MLIDKSKLLKYIDDELVSIDFIDKVTKINRHRNCVEFQDKSEIFYVMAFENEEYAKEGFKLLKKKLVDINWEKEFETYLDFINDNNDILTHLRNNYFWEICNKYFDRKISNKVKVRCRDGCIQIERV